jgi:hypothetical protein
MTFSANIKKSTELVDCERRGSHNLQSAARAPVGEAAVEAQVLRDPECRNGNAPLDLLAGLSCSFAGLPILPARLKRAFIHITPES